MNDPGQILPFVNVRSVDGYDPVAREHTSLLGRLPLYEVSHSGSGHLLAHAIDEGRAYKNGERKENIHQGTRHDNNGLLYPRFGTEFPGLGFSGECFLVQTFIYHTRDFHVPPERNRRNTVIRFSDLFPHDSRRISEGKTIHSDSEKLGGQEMTQFMDKNQDSQHKDCSQHGNHTLIP